MRYKFGNLSLDTDARELRRGDEPLHLSTKALDLLTMLIAERRRVVPKGELQDRLWPSTFVVEANLPVLIREIRAAVGHGEPDIIRTVHRIGYAFAVPIREVRANEELNRGRDVAHVLLYDNREVHLGEGENLVGREPASEVFIPSASVSRRHAVVTVRSDRVTVADLASKNGTFIGSERVQEESSLVDGNEITFGKVKVIYRRCLPSTETATFD